MKLVQRAACTLCALAIVAAPSAAGRSDPVDTLYTTRAEIGALSVTPRRVGWIEGMSGGCRFAVMVRSFSSGTPRRLGTVRYCNRYPAAFYPTAFALTSGGAVLVSQDEGGSSTTTTVLTFDTASLRTRLVATYYDPLGSDPKTHFGGLSAGGTTAVWGHWRETTHGPLDCADTRTCRYRVEGGGVRRFSARDASAIPNAPPAALVGASGRKVAVFAVRRGSHRKHPPAPDRVVLLRIADGAVLSSFPLREQIRNLALSGSTLVDLPLFGRKLEFRSLPEGRVTRRVPLPTFLAPGLSLAAQGRLAAFGNDRYLAIVDGQTGRVHLVRGATNVLEVGFSGRFVVWVQRSSGGYSIRRVRIR